MKLINSIKEHEGFSNTPYKDNKGHLTIGYGTNIEYISEVEAEMLLHHRVELSQIELSKIIDIQILMELEEEQLEALIEFNYWLGSSTFKKFKKMIKAINERDFVEASKQMLDSKVGREYKTRVTNLANKLKG